MKKIAYSVFLFWFLVGSLQANWFLDIINTINAQSGLTNNLLQQDLTIQKDILSSQKDINELIRQMNGSLIGHQGWGQFQFQDYQSYGGQGANWYDVMNMSGEGSGKGELGNSINHLSKDFPIDTYGFSRGIRDRNQQKYYALKSQTILAIRAASQLDYDKIQKQIVYQQMLKDQIEKTDNLKAATDLANRIQVEGNLINLEILRQIALSNQQMAVDEQASVNTALLNAKFLTR